MVSEDILLLLFACGGRSIARAMILFWAGLCKVSEPSIPVYFLFLKLDGCGDSSDLLPLERVYILHAVAEQLQEVPDSIQSPPPSAGFQWTTWR